jgi:xanthine dehydrogenase accessory factor
MPAMEFQKEEIYREIVRLLEAGRRGALATVIGSTGSTPGKEAAKMLIRDDGSTVGTIGGGCTEAEVWALAREAIDDDRPLRKRFILTPKKAEEDGLACGGIVEIFIEPLGSPVVILFGAGHIARTVAPLCKLVGLNTKIVDDREQFASKAFFPTAGEILVTDFETCFEKLTITPASYLVIVTRGHRHDQLVLSQAVRTPASFVGLIGSRAKISRIFRTLIREGASKDRLAAVKAPIGLDLGARTPEEIAVSIVAQLVAHRRRSYRKRNDPERMLERDGPSEAAAGIDALEVSELPSPELPSSASASGSVSASLSASPEPESPLGS